MIRTTAFTEASYLAPGLRRTSTLFISSDDSLRGIKQNVNEQNVSVKQAWLLINELRSTSSTSGKKQNVHKTYTERTIAHTLRRAHGRFFDACRLFCISWLQWYESRKKTLKMGLKTVFFVLAHPETFYFRFYFIKLSNIMRILYICRRKPI